MTVNIAGYPPDKPPPGTQWFHSRVVGALTSRTILYDVDTAPGQSGAPVWRFIEGKRYVVGTHTNGDLGGNSATRIVDSVYDNIRTWVIEAGGTPAFTDDDMQALQGQLDELEEGTPVGSWKPGAQVLA